MSSRDDQRIDSNFSLSKKNDDRIDSQASNQFLSRNHFMNLGQFNSDGNFLLKHGEGTSAFGS